MDVTPMDTTPTTDELRIRGLLAARGVSLNPAPAVVPKQRKERERERDWLDDILEDQEPVAPTEEKAEQGKPEAKAAKPKKSKKGKGKKGKGKKQIHIDVRRPRQSLADAWAHIPARPRWLAYHGSAALFGWGLGLVQWSTHVTAWIAATGLTSGQACFWYCASAATLLIYRRTRHWWAPVAWLAAVPAASTITGVLLYAPHP